MQIAILGAGNVGSALSSASTKAGHSVVLSASSPDEARAVAEATGARAVAANAEAVDGADVVVLAVPAGAVAGLVNELGSALAGKVVLDATNPINETYSDLTTSVDSAGEQLQRQAPDAFVVKAFNTIFAGRHANPIEDGQPLDAFLAGDHAAAKTTVGAYAESLGYRVVDTGGMKMARSLEHLALVNISLNAGNGWSFQSGWKLVGPTANV